MEPLSRWLCFIILWSFQVTATDFRHADIRLPQNTVLDMLEDQHGFLWVATGAGLVKYDGYQVQNFLHQPDVPNSLSQNLVLNLLEDDDGSIWVATNNGISRYRANQGFVRYLYLEGGIERDWSHRVSLMYRDPSGRIWAGGINGLYWYDRSTDQFISVQLPSGLASHRVDNIRWQDNSLWFSGQFGLARLTQDQLSSQAPQVELLYSNYPVADWFHDSRRSLFLSIYLPQGSDVKPTVVRFSGQVPDQLPTVMNDLPIFFFHCDRSQRCWGYGANRVYRLLSDGQFKQYTFSDDANSTSLIETKTGEVLVSAGTGIFRYAPEQDVFAAMSVEQTHLRSVKTQFFETSDGSIWVATHVNGLFHWASSMQKFQTILPPQSAKPGAQVIRVVYENPDQHSLWLASDNGQLLHAPLPAQQQQTISGWQSLVVPGPHISQIHNLYHLSTQQVLVGTSGGLMLWQQGQTRLTQAPLQAELPGHKAWQHGNPTEQSTQVLDMVRDQRCLWLATTAGLGCADLSGNTLQRWYGTDTYPAFQGNYLYRIYLARDGALWLSSTKGLIRFDPLTEQLEHFIYEQDNPNSLSHNWVHGVWELADNEFWVATREGGLNRLRYHKDQPASWQRFGIAQGLPTEVLYAVLGDSAGLLWLSSNQGIFSFNPQSGQVRQYSLEDGLQSTEFNFSVAHIGASGRFYFGGVAGANSFIPSTIRNNPVAPRTQLAGLRVNEQAIDLSSLPEHGLALKHNQNHLVFDVLALQYADPQRNQYAWKLDGIDHDWIDSGNSRQARYGALPAGTYQFWLKAANPDGVWSDPKLMLTFSIQRHPLLSYPAIGCYVLLLLLALWGYKFWRDQTEQRLQSKIEQGIAREKILNKSLRIQFEHTAHEMRTPLMRLHTHIKRSLTAMQELQPQQAVASLKTADVAQQELQRLIDRQMAVEELKLQDGGIPIHQAARPIVLTELRRYQMYADEKTLHLSHHLADATVLAVQGVLEIVCGNLLSNAVKYTPSGGSIHVELTQQAPWLELSVRDTGPGIAADEQEKIFLHHYRIPGHQQIPGSGLGLFLVKSCIEDAGGRIRVQSTLGEGSVFIVHLPLGTDSQRQVMPQLAPQHAEMAQHSPVVRHAPAHNRPSNLRETILLIEDHAGLLADLYSLLSPRYHCILADNGKLGLQLAQQQLPDMVISDVMMEQANSGFVLLQALKSHDETSHIPILLLTALHDETNRLKGLNYQADAYLSKPASERSILATIETLLNQRWRMGEHIRRALHNAQQQSKPLTPAERFHAKLQGIFTQLYQNPDTQVQDIAVAFGKSTSVLQKLTKEYELQSLKESLRDFRLQQAMRLLEQSTDCPIDHIAEQCGFGSTRSLQRDFKTCFQLTPQQYRDGSRPLHRPNAIPHEET